MTTHLSSPTVTAIIAAHNEAPRIAAVLRVITTYPHFTDTIVIDDGSDDATGHIAQQFPVRYLRNDTNLGKGAAMDRAVAAATGSVIFFCDADVTGLTHDTITKILTPVMNGSRDMSIAMRYHATLYYFPWVLPFIFWLGGERAVTARLWHQVPAYYKHQFRIEAALNFYARRYGRGLTCAFYPKLRQPTKDKKMGFIRGNRRRAAFIVQILATALRLRLTAGKGSSPSANTANHP